MDEKKPRRSVNGNHVLCATRALTSHLFNAFHWHYSGIFSRHLGMPHFHPTYKLWLSCQGVLSLGCVQSVCSQGREKLFLHSDTLLPSECLWVPREDGFGSYPLFHSLIIIWFMGRERFMLCGWATLPPATMTRGGRMELSGLSIFILLLRSLHYASRGIVIISLRELTVLRDFPPCEKVKGAYIPIIWARLLSRCSKNDNRYLSYLSFSQMSCHISNIILHANAQCQHNVNNVTVIVIKIIEKVSTYQIILLVLQ